MINFLITFAAVIIKYCVVLIRHVDSVVALVSTLLVA